ncbi:MAG: ChaN family lipoprotein [Sphingobacterium sp.]|uniref:ChaN family lipoprotein n=1 Tax=Sphingobacterium sp. JB170 TaxID=1434842 RepID=UPI00097F035A|nr:ChaN family lipoprotein [Sphingobacterium sp. JB170]SJN26676.1 Uncharacterized iron-regulated protein [Sphingobacterium sp. JB170]
MKKQFFLAISIWILISIHKGYGADTLATHYRIVEVASGEEISVDTLADRLAKASVVFFGEEHDDPVAHALELAVLKRLYLHWHGAMALSMEMFQTDIQPIVDEYIDDVISERNFIKEARAWKNYGDYRSLLHFVKEHRIDFLAANTPDRYSNLANRKGLPALDSLSAWAKSFLPPLPIDTLGGAYHEKFFKQMEGAHFIGMQYVYQAHCLWDANMAWVIARYLKNHPQRKVLHINGRFHSDDHLGIIQQLQIRYRPGTKVLSISSVASPAFRSNEEMRAYARNADFLILTDAGLERTH